MVAKVMVSEPERKVAIPENLAICVPALSAILIRIL